MDHQVQTISTSKHTFGKVIWDKLPEFSLENFEIARVTRGISNFSKIVGVLSHKLLDTTM